MVRLVCAQCFWRGHKRTATDKNIILETKIVSIAISSMPTCRFYCFFFDFRLCVGQELLLSCGETPLKTQPLLVKMAFLVDSWMNIPNDIEIIAPCYRNDPTSWTGCFVFFHRFPLCFLSWFHRIILESIRMGYPGIHRLLFHRNSSRASPEWILGFHDLMNETPTASKMNQILIKHGRSFFQFPIKFFFSNMKFSMWKHHFQLCW